jgi:formate-dependent nitrite reductase cytochrome c552 subunit
VITSLANRFQGKLRQAEYQLTRFVDKFEEAKNVGVDEATLNKARELHYDAHIHWEWWTASNGAHFHTPDEATASINKGMTFAQEGIKLLDDAMAKRRGDSTKTAATPAATQSGAPAAQPASAPAK